MATERICMHCGEPESAHCEFETVPLPAGCRCDEGTWAFVPKVRPICGTYVESEGDYCATCEHDKACHGN